MTVSSTPSPCNLPAIPRPVVWGGLPEMVDGKQTGRTILTEDGLAELGGYLKAVRDWIAAASGCINAR